MSDWQPIETAPKDGTGVLIFSPTYAAQLVAFWHDGKDGKGWATPFQRNGYMPIGRDARPTHWLPLPLPPA